MGNNRAPGATGMQADGNATDENNNKGEITVKGVASGWLGWEISLRNKTAIRLNNQNFFYTGRPQPGMWTPKGGSTSVLFLYKAENPKKVFRLDYHALNNTGGKAAWHYNKTKGLAHIDGLKVSDHAVTPDAKALGRSLTVFRWAGRAMFVAGMVSSGLEIYHATNKTRTVISEASGWTGAITAGRYCASVGAKMGASTALAAGQLGPQVAAPEEIATVPIGAFIGGAIGGIVCGATGFFAGKEISETVYDWIFTPMEKEEWVILDEKPRQ